MERIEQFLPSILILLGIAVLAFIYLKFTIKRLGQNFKSVEWHQENKWKVMWSIGIPAQNIWAPTAEELIFRAPLIVAFSVISPQAWIGILVSSVAFAAIHWFGKKVNILEIISKKEKGDAKTDSVEAELAQIEEASPRGMRIRRIAHVIAVIPLGVLAGFYGIEYQSIWISVGIHAMWNLFMPLILLILAFIVSLLFLGVSSLWDRIH